MKRKDILRVLMGSTAFILFCILIGLVSAVGNTANSEGGFAAQELRPHFGPGTVEPAAHLPVVQYDPTSTPTPPPQSILLNGNFEQGPVAWSQYSSNGWSLILQVGQLLVPPRSGTWAVWLGGDYDEASIISQQITLYPGDATLYYWHWIASADLCNPEYDIAGVFINETAVDAFLLCEAAETDGWRLRTVDLSAYAAQSVVLHIAAFTDSSLNSNLFIDDVSLEGISRGQSPTTEAILDGAAEKAGFVEERSAPVVIPAFIEELREALVVFEGGDWVQSLTNIERR